MTTRDQTSTGGAEPPVADAPAGDASAVAAATNSARPTFGTIDEYIAGFPPSVQARLEAVRALIAAAAPDATQTISYAIPTFALHGNLVHFAAFKRHVGFYPGAAGVQTFASELAGFKTSKGTIQLPFDQPLPAELITTIVRYRREDNLAKAAAKRGVRKP